MSFFRRLARRCANEDGQAMVEMALVTPIVLVVVLLGISSLLGAGSKAVIQDAAAGGARYAALGEGSPTAIVTQILQENQMPVSGSNPVVTSQSNGGYVTVTVQYDQPTLVPGITSMLPGGGGPGSNWNLTGAATMKIE